MAGVLYVPYLCVECVRAPLSLLLPRHADINFDYSATYASPMPWVGVSRAALLLSDTQLYFNIITRQTGGSNAIRLKERNGITRPCDGSLCEWVCVVNDYEIHHPRIWSKREMRRENMYQKYRNKNCTDVHNAEMRRPLEHRNNRVVSEISYAPGARGGDVTLCTHEIWLSYLLCIQCR